MTGACPIFSSKVFRTSREKKFSACDVMTMGRGGHLYDAELFDNAKSQHYAELAVLQSGWRASAFTIFIQYESHNILCTKGVSCLKAKMI